MPLNKSMAVNDTFCAKNLNSSDGSKNYINFVEPSDKNLSDFNFIYDLAGYEYQSGYKIKGAGLNITNLNTENKVYYRTSYSNSVDGYRPSYSGSQLKSLAIGSGGTSVLSNCVGYVCSRVNEIWKIAVESGYISLKGDDYYINHEDRKILGAIKIPHITSIGQEVPNRKACLMWEKWGTIPGCLTGHNGEFKGWARSSKDQTTNSLPKITDVGPFPGCIICWGDYNDNNLNTESCGHVGFVEKVVNPGTDDEYIIYSESGYDDYHIKDNKIVQIRSIGKYDVSKKFPYSLSSKRRCVGFLLSPISQLIPSVSFNSQGIFGARPINISKEELDLRGIGNQPKVWGEQKNPLKGDKVQIKSIGYKEPNNNKKPVNLIKSVGSITAIIPEAEYPYGVSINNSFLPTAFYKRNGLIFK